MNKVIVNTDSRLKSETADFYHEGIAMLQPNFAEAERYLKNLDPDTDMHTFQTLCDKKSGISPDKVAVLNNVFYGTFNELKFKLGALNNLGAGIFAMVNKGDGVCHGGAKTCRTIESVIAVRALFVDLDGAPLEPALNYKIKPSMVIQTSADRYHVYWLSENIQLDQFKPLQQALATNLNGDRAVCDLPRVMRLPGFYHMKGEPFMVKLIEPREQV